MIEKFDLQKNMWFEVLLSLINLLMVVVSVEDSIFFFKENGVICFKLRDYLWEDMVLMDFL